MTNIQDTVKNLNKKYGVDTASLASKTDDIKIESVSTGCYSFDKIIGVDGIPLGRIIDLYGLESQGKSTVALHIAAKFQEAGKVVAWVDTEMCYTNEYAKALGVDTSKLILLQPIYGEQAMNALVDLINPKDGKPVCSLVVVDSTANITSRKEIENDMEKDTIALQARLIGRALRVITAPAAKNKVTVLFISQLRNRIGMFVGTGYVATGGMALKFYSSVRMRVSTIKKLKGKDDNIIGNRLKIKVEKNKVAKPFGEAEVDLYFERGIDIVGDILDVATGEGIVAKSGNTYSYAGNKIGVGRTATIKYLEDHKEVFTEVKKQLLAIDKELLIKQNL